MGLASILLPKVSGRMRVDSLRHSTDMSDSPDLRARFIRSEAALFRHRFMNDAGDERAAFLQEQKFDWHLVGDTEKTQFAAELKACMPPNTVRDFAYESWFKVRLCCRALLF